MNGILGTMQLGSCVWAVSGGGKAGNITYGSVNYKCGNSHRKATHDRILLDVFPLTTYSPKVFLR